MTVYQWLCLLGIPTLITGGLFPFIVSQWRKQKALQKGLQAMLRSQMVNDYHKWEALGYAPIYARDNFENCWKNYHALGVNGVMDDLHEKFMELPTHKEH